MAGTWITGRGEATLPELSWDGSSLGVAGLSGCNNDPTNATDPTGLEEQQFSGPYGPR